MAEEEDYFYEVVKNGGLEVNLNYRYFGDEGAKQIARALMEPDIRAGPSNFSGTTLNFGAHWP